MFPGGGGGGSSYSLASGSSGGTSNSGSSNGSSNNEEGPHFQVPEVVVTGKKGYRYTSDEVYDAMMFAFAKVMKDMERQENRSYGTYGTIGGLASYLANAIDGFIGTTDETFYSFSGGTKDPDPYSLDKLRPRDKIEANNMFEYILNGYGRALKFVNVRPDHFQVGIDMASLSSLPRGNGFYPPGGIEGSDTLGIWTTQATGILRMSDGTPYGLKYENVRGEGLSQRTLDSLNKAVNDSNNYWNKQLYKR